MAIERSELPGLRSICEQYEEHKAVFKNFIVHLRELIEREEGLGIASIEENGCGLEILYLDRPLLISYSFALLEEEMFGDGLLLASVPEGKIDKEMGELDRVFFDLNGNIRTSQRDRESRFNITHKQDVSKLLYRFLLVFLRSPWFHNRRLLDQSRRS